MAACGRQLYLLIALISFSSVAQESCRLSITYSANKKNKILLNVSETSYLLQPKSGVLFEDTIFLNSPQLIRLVDFKSGYTKYAFIEPGNVTIEIQNNGKKMDIRVVGSENHDFFEKLQFEKDNGRFMEFFSKYPNHPVSLQYIEGWHKFLKLEKEAYLQIFNLIDLEKHVQIPSFIAFIKTIDSDRLVKGSIISDFSGYTADSLLVNTASSRGKYLMLDFGASWCGPCLASLPHIAEFKEKYEQLDIITINEDHNIERWDKHLSAKNLELIWPVIWKMNNKEEIFNIYGINSYPTYYLVDPEGIIVEHWMATPKVFMQSKLKKYLD